jgi:hypothetical protein
VEDITMKSISGQFGPDKYEGVVIPAELEALPWRHKMLCAGCGELVPDIFDAMEFVEERDAGPLLVYYHHECDPIR